MGLISDTKAVGDVQKIMNGGTAKLSYSQICNLIINLPDASKNLSPQEFNAVYHLFRDIRKSTTKYTVDQEGYYRMAVEIIREFDRIAPYEAYSGASEFETRMLMRMVRSMEDPVK